MGQIINWRDHINKVGSYESTLLGYLLVEFIANDKKLDKQFKQGKLDITQLDMKVTINGVEVDVEEVFADIETQMDKLITENAQRILDKEFSEFKDNLFNLRASLTDILHMAQTKAKG